MDYEPVFPVRANKTLFKHTTIVPAVVTRAAKQKADKSAWRKTAKAVDTRDERNGAPRCFITGKRLQTSNTLDEWTFRDRAHIVARSKSKADRFNEHNVLSVSRGVHKLIDSSALFLLDKQGRPARSVQAIDHCAWNRRLVPRGSEPCKVKLPVVELDQVKD